MGLPLHEAWPPPLSCYDYTRQLTRSRWSWEYLRRNATYARTWLDGPRVAKPSAEVPGLRRITLSRPDPAAERWGLSFLR